MVLLHSIGVVGPISAARARGPRLLLRSMTTPPTTTPEPPLISIGFKRLLIAGAAVVGISSKLFVGINLYVDASVREHAARSEKASREHAARSEKAFRERAEAREKAVREYAEARDKTTKESIQDTKWMAALACAGGLAVAGIVVAIAELGNTKF
jgi:hypothetical protein